MAASAMQSVLQKCNGGLESNLYKEKNALNPKQEFQIQAFGVGMMMEHRASRGREKEDTDLVNRKLINGYIPSRHLPDSIRCFIFFCVSSIRSSTVLN